MIHGFTSELKVQFSATAGMLSFSPSLPIFQLSPASTPTGCCGVVAHGPWTWSNVVVLTSCLGAVAAVASSLADLGRGLMLLSSLLVLEQSSISRR